MPGTNAGTGCPIAFRCHQERRHTIDPQRDPNYRNHTVHVTGRERPAGGNRNIRMDTVTREYVCSCGHTGWSRHIDLAKRKWHPQTPRPGELEGTDAPGAGLP